MHISGFHEKGHTLEYYHLSSLMENIEYIDVFLIRFLALAAGDDWGHITASDYDLPGFASAFCGVRKPLSSSRRALGGLRGDLRYALGSRCVSSAIALL